MFEYFVQLMKFVLGFMLLYNGGEQPIPFRDTTEPAQPAVDELVPFNDVTDSGDMDMDLIGSVSLQELNATATTSSACSPTNGQNFDRADWDSSSSERLSVIVSRALRDMRHRDPSPMSRHSAVRFLTRDLAVAWYMRNLASPSGVQVSYVPGIVEGVLDIRGDPENVHRFIASLHFPITNGINLHVEVLVNHRHVGRMIGRRGETIKIKFSSPQKFQVQFNRTDIILPSKMLALKYLPRSLLNN